MYFSHFSIGPYHFEEHHSGPAIALWLTSYEYQRRKEYFCLSDYVLVYLVDY